MPKIGSLHMEERCFQIFPSPYMVLGPNSIAHSAQGPVNSILCTEEILIGRTGASIGYIIHYNWGIGDRGF
jgi:hypothetical protein